MASATPRGSSQKGLWPRPSKIFTWACGKRIAQGLAHVFLHDRILAAPNEQSGSLEAGQGALQIAVDIIGGQRLIENREPDAQRDAGGIFALPANEIGVHRRRRVPPGDHEGRVRVDGFLELADLGGEIELPGFFGRPGRRAAGRGDQHHVRRSFRPVFGEGLGNDAAQRVPDDVGLAHAERVQQQLDVVGKVEPGVAALGLAGLPMSADVDQDQPVVLRQVGQHGHPIARVVGVAMDQHDDGSGAAIVCRRPLSM